jgi:mRNA interferase RelE/StbE
MAWYRLAYRPAILIDLGTLEPTMAQRLLDKTKWIASNIDNLRHEAIAPDLPGLSKYSVEDWRIFYVIDRDNHLVDIHGIVRHTETRL